MRDGSEPWRRLRWTASDAFEVGGIAFDLVSWGSPRKHSSGERFVLVKDAPFAESMRRILEGLEVRRVLEFGLYHGGSLVLLDRLYGLECAVGIDDRSEMPALQAYRREQDAQERVVPYLGADQADRARVGEILRRHFPERDLDLVIDDASHLHAESTASFEVAFPFLRPGGAYVIEDWGWAHWPRAFESEDWFTGTPLSALVMELLLVQASHPGWIDRILVDYHHVAVYKGAGFPTSLADDELVVGASYLSTRDIAIPARAPE